MTAFSTLGRAGRPLGQAAAVFLLPVALTGSLLLLARLAVEPRSLRIALLAGAASLILGLGAIAPRRLLYTLVVWLAALGLVRRLVLASFPVEGLDPLLLVEPAALAILALVAGGRGAFRHHTRLSHAVLALSALILLGAVNPLGGSLLGGLTALLFILVPTLGFWIGRGLCDDRTIETVFKLVAGLALAAALYGLAQTFRGFPSWDDNWIRVSGYEALYVYGETVRPFASFSAASDYVTFLGIGLVAWLGFGLRKISAGVTTAVLAVLGLALVYATSRGIIVQVVAALGFMAGAWKGMRLGVSVLVATTLVLLLPFVLARVTPDYTEGSATAGTSSLVTHQASGLANPLDPTSSTLVAHLTLVVGGFASVASNPLGVGISVVTIAGSKFGAQLQSTEADPSNVAVALGIPGLIAYFVVFSVGIRRTYALASHRRDSLSLVALAVLIVTLFQWLSGGNYAAALFPWLALGWADRQAAPPRS